MREHEREMKERADRYLEKVNREAQEREERQQRGVYARMSQAIKRRRGEA
jgi:hypothetical protein